MPSRVLIVEDETFLALFLEKVLREADCAILGSAKKARQAVAMFQASMHAGSPPDVIFMDVNLPGGQDGIWAAQEIRATDPGVPIIFFTAYADRDTCQRLARLEPGAIVQKPATEDDILSALRAVGPA